jgi:hypothetical protein
MQLYIFATAFRTHLHRYETRRTSTVSAQARHVSLPRYQPRLSGGSKVESVRLPLSASLRHPILMIYLYSANATSKYYLTAVVAHEGTLSQGHYTAFVRGADDVRSSFLPSER